MGVSAASSFGAALQASFSSVPAWVGPRPAADRAGPDGRCAAAPGEGETHRPAVNTRRRSVRGDGGACFGGFVWGRWTLTTSRGASTEHEGPPGAIGRISRGDLRGSGGAGCSGWKVGVAPRTDPQTTARSLDVCTEMGRRRCGLPVDGGLRLFETLASRYDRVMSAAWHPGQCLTVGFEGTEVPRDLAEVIEAGRVGGIILFSRNIEGPGQLRALTQTWLASHRQTRLDSVDQEGGRVQRLREPWTRWPPMRAVGEHDHPAQTRALGERSLEAPRWGHRLELRALRGRGLEPDNPVIGDRSFGTTHERIEARAPAARGDAGRGVAPA